MQIGAPTGQQVLAQVPGVRHLWRGEQRRGRGDDERGLARPAPIDRGLTRACGCPKVGSRLLTCYFIPDYRAAIRPWRYG